MDCQYSGWTPAAGTPVPRVDISGITPREFFEYVATWQGNVLSSSVLNAPKDGLTLEGRTRVSSSLHSEK